jgi:serine phosphatase RsbU (regulator of sigma subunit)
MMKPGSIKTKLYLILAFVVLLLFLLILNVFLQRKEQSLEEQISKASDLEKVFLAITHDEHVVIEGMSFDNNKIVGQYALFKKQFASSSDESGKGVNLINHRQRIFENFIQTNIKSAEHFQTAHDTLEDLVASVRFIHSFHIVHLKNIAARGAMGELETVEEAFERSPVQGASEVEIVESAVSVQGYLLDIFNSFEAMQRGHEYSEIEIEFTENLRDFYKAVNQFEDYSLDAQDGLLVEELLLNGEVIKSLFSSLVNNKKKIEEMTRQLISNEHLVADQINLLITALHDKTSVTKTFIKVFQTLSQLFTILLVGWIIVNGRRIIKGLIRTIKETRKIQHDVSYRIADGQAYFDEFSIVYKALNNMAKQIHRHMQELEVARDTLEIKVHERTGELEEKNRELNESFEKVELYSKMLKNELERGRRMQTSFLPGELLKIDNWEIMPYFKPAKQVAGDFYDIFNLPGGRIAMVVADVCDKGVGAALFMALFRSLIRVFSGKTMLEGFVLPSQEISAEMLDTTDEMLVMTSFEHLKTLNAIKLTNNYIALNHGDLSMFATVFFGVLNPENGLLSYINGGHEPLIIISPDGGVKRYLSPTGPAVGVMPDVEFLIKQTVLAPGETMLAYTDGVTEALSADNKEFSKERLFALCDKPSSSTKELLENIARELNSHMEDAEQFDDITMLAVRKLT